MRIADFGLKGGKKMNREILRVAQDDRVSAIESCSVLKSAIRNPKSAIAGLFDAD